MMKECNPPRSTGRAFWSGRIVGCLTAAVAAAAVGAAWYLKGSGAAGEHAFNYPPRYLASMRSAQDPETTCVRVYPGSGISHQEARDRVANTLFNPQRVNEDWDGVDFIRFQDQVLHSECPWWTEWPDSIKIAVEVRASVDLDCPQGASGCEHLQDKYGTVYTEGAAPISHIVMRADRLNASLINHEVGHTFGLCDGGPSYPYDPDPACQSSGQQECTGSVMHTYGCGNASAYPTDADRATVERIAWFGHADSGGGGGGCRAYGFGGCL